MIIFVNVNRCQTNLCNVSISKWHLCFNVIHTIWLHHMKHVQHLLTLTNMVYSKPYFRTKRTWALHQMLGVLIIFNQWALPRRKGLVHETIYNHQCFWFGLMPWWKPTMHAFLNQTYAWFLAIPLSMMCVMRACVYVCVCVQSQCTNNYLVLWHLLWYSEWTWS